MAQKKGKPAPHVRELRAKRATREPTAKEGAEPAADGDGGAAAGEEPVVVGLGASAGGLEALQVFFENMPPQTGLAFVIVTHQLPNRSSLLPLLLAKRTAMPVHEVGDGMQIEPDHVYVAPPGRNLGVLNGRLHTFDSVGATARHLPIDHFFRSLARDRRERAIGVVLSGTGSDGTLGLKEIKAALGVSIVQEEEDAGFSGMPHSAIVGDTPDFVLPVADIPAKLLGYVRAARSARAHPGARSESDQALDALARIFMLVRQHTGHDFSAYKETTVRRRIERRMNLQRADSLADYAHHLQLNPAEIERLFEELLIGVTSFFRDPEAFESLGKLFAEAIADKPDGATVRVWVAGCSTGEEAYSIAILFRECLDRHQRDLQVQVFATDLDPKAIEHARTGFYPAGIAGDMPPKRLKRFFVQHEGGYQVRKEIREMLVFATQNLIEDPPFTKLDVLSCRNLLIYLDASLQKRLFPIFHYVLKPQGMLLLGSSETIGSFAQLFEPLDKKWRIYRRKEVVGSSYVAEIPASVPSVPLTADTGQLAALPKRAHMYTAQMAEKLLLRELVPPTLIMRERGEILHIHGRTGLFLEPAPGFQASANVFNMVREGLHLELSAALREAAREGDEVVRRGVHVKTNGHTVLVDLRVKRLLEPEPLRGLFRVSFERTRAVEAERTPEAGSGEPSSNRVVELERELQYTKESHQSTIEELETANEELKSTNEELQSTNEELQSANEELETSKEELQSLNEELLTVNVELQSKVEELSRANDDMTNFLNATDIATIFLDHELNIKRHTEQAKRVIRLIPSDVGRSIGDLVSRLRYDHLVEDAREVLRTLAFKETEVQGEGDGKWYLMRILPYRTIDNVIDGLVVTFVDITRVKLLQQSEQRLIQALSHSPVCVFGVQSDLRFSWACGIVFGREEASIDGKTFDEAFGDEQPELRALLQRMLASDTPLLRAQLESSVKGRKQRFDLYLERQPHGRVADVTCVAVQLTLDVVGSEPARSS